MRRTIACIIALLASASCALAQGTVLQGGSWSAGRAPMYVGAGSGQAVVQDSGSAGGGAVGLGLKELLLVARGTGTPPYVGQGSGPLGTNFCSYDAPTTNATGYHYLCWGANPGQMVYGAGGAAAAQSFCFTVNGAPMCLGGTTGTGIVTAVLPTTAGSPSCWVNATGELTDCSAGAATLFGRPTTSGNPGPFTIQGLTARGPPDANNDKIPVYDNAAGTIKYVTPGLIAASATAGVSSIAGVVGPLTLGPNLSMVGSQITFGIGGSSGQIQWNNGGTLDGFTTAGDVVITPSTGATVIQPNAVTTAKILDANVTTAKIADLNVTTIKVADNNVTNAKLATGAANTVKGSINGTTTSDLAIASCSALYSVSQWITGTGWSCGINPVLPSRAVAATLNLTAFTSVRTLGYATAGDGGDATFVKTAGQFVDSFISTGSITGNGTSGCTNNTYRGQVPNSPNTQGFQTAFTIVVSGNVVTTMTLTAPGNGYANGTVLSFTVPGCSTTVTWTISAVTTPSGSFTDTAANKWQIVMPAAGIDARSMGVKFDWSVAAGDAGSTDNFTNLQNSINFAAYAPGFIDTGSSNGGKVLLTRGTAMFCGGGTGPLKIWNGVTVQGQGATASVIKPCDTYANTVNFVELCDSASHAACFSAAFRDAQLFTTYTVGQGSASAATQAAIYTNSCQHQGCGVYNATIYPGACRQGIKAELGYGGASQVSLINEVEIKGGMKDANCGAAAPPAVGISGYVSTIIKIEALNMGGLSTASTFGPRTNGLAVTGGFVVATSVYAENIVAPVIANITGATNGFVNVRGFDAGTGCSTGFARLGTANTAKIESAFANSCTNTYTGSGAVVALAAVVF